MYLMYLKCGMYLVRLTVARQSRSPTTAVMGTAAAPYMNQNFPYTDSGPGKTVALTLLLTLLSGGGTVVASPYVNQNVQFKDSGPGKTVALTLLLTQ